MSVYLDVDDDGLYKTKKELLCICCSSRFEKYKLSVKVLKKFSEMATDYHQHEMGKKCSIDGGDPCSNCTTVSKNLTMTKPFECLSCGMVFAHALHLRSHKERSESCKKNLL